MSRVTAAAKGVLRAVGRVVGAVGRALTGAGRGFRAFWMGLSLKTRQRLAIALLAGVAAALVLAFTIPRLPCQFPGGDVCAPADDADALVPADALGYVHLTIDPATDQFSDAQDTLDPLPELTRQIVDRLLAQVPGPGGQAADFERDIAPWLGSQAAVAIVPVGGGAEQVQLLEAGDAEGAGEFAAALAAGEPRVSEYQGVEVATDDRGLATASVGGFLAIGTDAGVRRVIDVQSGDEDARPLSEDPVATELRDDLPAERFADAYVSVDGIETLIASESGALASLEPFVDAAASDGAAASLGAVDDGFEVSIRSVLDPERSESDPGFFAAFEAFEPTLPERLAPDSLAYVGIGDPGTTVNELLAQATAEAPALAEGLTEAANRLRDLGGVQVSDELLPALGGEAAFALQPGGGGSGGGGESEPEPEEGPDGLPQGPAPASDSVPILQFLADGVDSERARETLAQLQGSIAEALDPGTSLQAPVFDQQTYKGVEMEVLRVSPTVNLTYALAESSLAIASQPAGVEQVIDGEGGLDETDGFERATDGFAERPALLAYLDLTGLVELGEREGLAEDPVYALFAQEIRRLEAAALAVEASSTDVITDARIIIADDD
jgi:hypothetical protein